MYTVYMRDGTKKIIFDADSHSMIDDQLTLFNEGKGAIASFYKDAVYGAVNSSIGETIPFNIEEFREKLDERRDVHSQIMGKGNLYDMDTVLRSAGAYREIVIIRETLDKMLEGDTDDRDASTNTNQ